MSSCDHSNIRQNYIVTGTEQDILSACTAIYTNNINSCEDNIININSSLLNANNISADNINLSGLLTACEGIYTSNIYGCSPISIKDELILEVVSNNNTLNKLLVIDNNGLVEYRDVSSLIISGQEVIDYTYNNKNTFIITRNDNVTFSATINTVTGLTVNNGSIVPLNDGSSNIGTPIKRFRDINTLSGTSTVWTSTNQIITPNLNLGLDSNNNSRIITANNSIIQNDTLNGGTY